MFRLAKLKGETLGGSFVIYWAQTLVYLKNKQVQFVLKIQLNHFVFVVTKLTRNEFQLFDLVDTIKMRPKRVAFFIFKFEL